MKKSLLFLLAISFTCYKTVAKEIDYATAKTVAVNFSSTVQAFTTKALQTDLVYTKTLPNSPSAAFYVFNISNSGFVMVSADDNIDPILAYSTESTFDINNMPPQLKAMLDHYLQEASAVSMDTKMNTVANAAWDAYKQGQQMSTSRAQVAPLLTTTWGQSGFGYNKFCPGGSVTGCVATAISQILKYHNYPAKGNYHSEYALQQYGRLYTNYEEHTYNWANMPNALTSTSTTAQKDAVARLMSDVGRASNMCYTPTNSGTSTSIANYALHYYFGIDSKTKKHIIKSTMSNQAWKNILKTELDNARPLYYAATDTSLNIAHAVVVDGYDNSGLYHINWGWDGSYNGYFNILSFGASSYLFNSNPEIIIGIAPPAKVAAVPVLTSKISGPAKAVYKTPLKYTFTIKNPSTDTLKGGIRVDLYDSRTGGILDHNIILNTNSLGSIKLNPLGTAAITIETDSAIYIPTGKYKVYFTWGDHTTGVTGFLQATSSFANNLPVEIHHTATTISSVAISSVFTISNKSTFEDSKPFSVKVTLKNPSNTKNYTGNITAMFYDPYGYEVDALQTQTIKIDKGKTKVCTFQTNSLSINDHDRNEMYYVYLVDETDVNNPKLIAATTGNSSCAPISYTYRTCSGGVFGETIENEEQIGEGAYLSVFPNPSSTSATIRFNGNTSSITGIQIINMLGSSVFEKTITDEKEIIINTEELPNGMYFILLKDTVNGVLNTKLQVIH